MKAPIPAQEGLSKDTLDSMKAVIQKYKEVTNYTITSQKGISSQREQLKNLILNALVEDAKKKESMNPNDEYGNNDCIDSLVANLSKAMADIIKGQAWNVTTSVTTLVDFSPAWIGVTNGLGTGIAEPKDVTTE